jgi:amidase
MRCMMDDLVFVPANQLARTIRQRHASALEVLEAHLAHIARHNPALNAIVTLDEQGARQRAEAADRALAQGQVWGPLHGVPFTLEDIHATAHIRSTWGGSPSLAEHVPLVDGMIAARLKAAGAILIGKTHGPAIWGDASVFGRTNNPWDLERTPGGSSAGPAAALAAGLTPLDIGADTLGSIQDPAHCCGILGMRHTEHRVPLTDVFFIDPIRMFRVMSVVGPMARSVEDLRLALQIITGPDGFDSDVPPMSWREVERPDLRTLRIAWTPTFPEMPIDHEIYIAIELLARELDRMGAQIEQCLPEVSFEEQAQLGRHLFDLIAGASDPQPEGTRPTSLGDYFEALHRRDLLISTWQRFFADWDILLCPAGPIVAERRSDRELVVNGSVVPQEQKKLLDISYALSPMTGCPTVVIPLGRNQSGVPFGVQVMGHRWEDERLLAIAEVLSEITGGFQRPPGY